MLSIIKKSLKEAKAALREQEELLERIGSDRLEENTPFVQI
jgi:hypothetical protein